MHIVKKPEKKPSAGEAQRFRHQPMAPVDMHCKLFLPRSLIAFVSLKTVKHWASKLTQMLQILLFIKNAKCVTLYQLLYTNQTKMANVAKLCLLHKYAWYSSERKRKHHTFFCVEFYCIQQPTQSSNLGVFINQPWSFRALAAVFFFYKFRSDL